MGHSNNKTENYTDFFYYAFRNILIVSITLTIISALTLGFSTPHSSAENSSADGVSISIPSTCTMASNIVSPHTASMIGGTQTEVDSEGIGMGTTELDTVCNDKDGYLIYAKGITQNSSNEVILSSTIGSEYDIKTGTGTMSDNRSSWGMKLIPVSGSNQYPPDIVSTYTNFTSVPSNWTKVASKSSATSSITHSKLKTTYSVYITTEQPAGTYSGQVKYVMLHPSTTTVLPTTTLESAFAAAGKSKKTGVVDPVTGQTGSYYKMQDMNSSICDAVTPNDNPGYDEIQLVDDRDNKIYWVAKLRDGHCWMTQNLDLDLETTPSNVAALTSENTDLNDRSLTGAYAEGYNYDPNTGVLSWKPANTANTVEFTGTTVGNKWQRNSTLPYSASKTDGTGTGHSSLGNYYNWTVAIASNDSSALSASTHNDISKNPQNSICPKGWRLPTISNQAGSITNSTNEFARLNYLYNGNSSSIDYGWVKTPLLFIKSGFISGNLGDSYNGGYYRSSTVASRSAAYYLSILSNNIELSYQTYGDGNVSNRRGDGFSLRCVAR